MRGVLLALAALVALAPAANATDYCGGKGTVIDVGGVAYATLDHWYNPPYTTWVYLEANGERGLQRGGVTMLGDADVCQDSRTPDRGVL